MRIAKKANNLGHAPIKRRETVQTTLHINDNRWGWREMTLAKPKENAIIATIELPPEQNEAFKRMIKIGIYKELYRKALLTSAQLNTIISMQNNW